MESTSLKVNVPETRQSSKRLLFDRRYGWVFSIIPLAKGLVQMASQSINFTVTSARKAAENPQLFSPQNLQKAFDDGVQNFMKSMKIGKGLDLNKNSQSHASDDSFHIHTESNQ